MSIAVSRSNAIVAIDAYNDSSCIKLSFGQREDTRYAIGKYRLHAVLLSPEIVPASIKATLPSHRHPTLA